MMPVFSGPNVQVPAIGTLFHINSHDAVNDHRPAKSSRNRTLLPSPRISTGSFFQLRAMHPATAVQFRHVQFV
jgi:hypothetical protein